MTDGETKRRGKESLLPNVWMDPLVCCARSHRHKLEVQFTVNWWKLSTGSSFASHEAWVASSVFCFVCFLGTGEVKASTGSELLLH